MPSRIDYMGAIRQWLKDNGIATVRFGWIDPTREALGNCEFPVAAIIPDGGSLKALDTGPQTIEEGETIKILLWVLPSDSAFDDQFGGFKALWALRDKLLTAQSGVAALQTATGTAAPNSPYLSAQVDLSVSRWEDFWWSLDGAGYPGGELSFKLTNSLGPTTLPAA